MGDHRAGQTVHTVTFCEPMYSDCEGDLFCRAFLYWMQNLLNFFRVLVWQSMPSMQSEALAITLLVRQLNSPVLPRSQPVVSRMETVLIISLRFMKTVLDYLIWSEVHWLLTATCRQKRWPGSQLVPEEESPTLPYQVRQEDSLTEEMEQGSRFLHWPLTETREQAEERRARASSRAALQSWAIVQIYYQLSRIYTPFCIIPCLIWGLALYIAINKIMLKTLLVDYNPVARLSNYLFASSPFLQGIANYLKDLLLNKEDETLRKLLFLAGVSALTYRTWRALYEAWGSWGWIFPHLAHQSKLNASALKQKYGNCWVVITGHTQGIGKGFAEILAEFGFNLILISRDEERCRLKAEELQQKYKDVQIKYAACNMADKKEIARLEEIFEQWKELDIGMVVNNAGSVAGGPYFSIAPEMLVDDINVDLLAVFVINRILVPKMRTRQHRSAIINIASCTGVFLSSRVGVYSSTKRSLDIYSRIMQAENRDKIDVISVRPFGVSTKMMKFKKGPFMITPRQCAFSALADLLGGCKFSFTHFKHKLNSVPFRHLSEDEAFELYDYYWAQARAQAAD